MARLSPASLTEARDLARAYLLPDRRISGIGAHTLGKREKVNVYIENERDVWDVRGEIGGFETRPIYTGKLRRHALSPADFQKRYRPSPGGVSIGAPDGSAGTFGITVYEKGTGKRFILTNSHVAANAGTYPIGTQTYQPALLDGGVAGRDVIGRLAKYVQLYQSGLQAPYQNQVDVSLVEPLNDADITDDILGMDQKVLEAVPPTVGTQVMISSRNGQGSGSIITDTRATFKINDYPTEIAGNTSGQLTFYNCVVIEPAITAPGSSGGIFVDMANPSKAVALNFAGSDQMSIGNWLTTALEATGTVLKGEYVAGTDNANEMPPGVVLPNADTPPPIPSPGSYFWNYYIKPNLPYILAGAIGLVVLVTLVG